MRPIKFNLKKYKREKLEDFVIKKGLLGLLLFAVGLVFLFRGAEVSLSLKKPKR